MISKKRRSFFPQLKHTELKVEIAGLVLLIKFADFEDDNYPKYILKEAIIDSLSHFSSSSIRKKSPHAIISFINEEGDVLFHKENNAFYHIYTDISPTIIATHYNISIKQFDLILWKILYNILSTHDGFLLHASSITTKQGALVFLGKSGTGKSTMMHLLKDTYKAIGDDCVIIRKMNDEWRVYQTPFIEKYKYLKKNSEPNPLHSVIILKQGHENLIRSLKKSSSRKRLIREDALFNTKAEHLAIFGEFINTYTPQEFTFTRDMSEVTQRISNYLHESSAY